VRHYESLSDTRKRVVELLGLDHGFFVNVSMNPPLNNKSSNPLFNRKLRRARRLWCALMLCEILDGKTADNVCLSCITFPIVVPTLSCTTLHLWAYYTYTWQ